MRVFRLIVLGLLAYVVSVVFLFPAAPLVEKIKPNVQPLQLAGVSGKLFKGEVASVNYADDLLPLEFQDVTWKLAPATVLKGGTGADVSFKGYGGGGQGQVRRQWNGDIVVSDFAFNADSKQLEPLLPAPIANFSGKISGNVSSLELVNQQLGSMDGTLTWNDAVINTLIYGPNLTANLGKFDVVVTPENDETHVAKLSSAGGDLVVDGSITISANGDYRTNLILTPAANAPRELVDTLQRFTRPDGGGRFRVQHNGNLNQGT